MSLLFDLTGKTALVTGCRRGIGLSIATALAEAGADIIGVSASQEAVGGAAGEAVRATGRKFTPYQADFGDRKSLHAFLENVTDDFPAIDILVNNAGTILRNIRPRNIRTSIGIKSLGSSHRDQPQRSICS